MTGDGAEGVETNIIPMSNLRMKSRIVYDLHCNKDKSKDYYSEQCIKQTMKKSQEHSSFC